jgi:hypothetical protein
VGLSATLFCFVGLHFGDVKNDLKCNESPSCSSGLLFGLFMYSIAMERPLIGGFVEKKNEIKCPAWSGKTTEGLDSPSDCHKTAKIISDEDAS